MGTNQMTGREATYELLPDDELRALIPRVLPAGWRENTMTDARGCFDNNRRGLRVVFSAGVEEDRKKWLHLSVSHRDGVMPTWEELLEVRDVFAGPERLAIHVYPPRSEHWSHPNSRLHVMHLWICLEGSPLPNFLRARGGTL